MASPLIVTNISALQTSSGSATDLAAVEYFNTLGDRGGGLFYYNIDDTTSEDNGGTIIVNVPSGRRYYRVYDELHLDFFLSSTERDGLTDNSVGFANALSAARAANAKLICGPGRILIGSASLLGVLENVEISGEGVDDANDLNTTGTQTRGTTFLITDDSQPLFFCGESWSIEGCNFVYPNQTDTTTPIQYPPLLASTGSSPGMSQCMFRNNRIINCYDFLAADGVGTYNGTAVAPYCGDIIIDNCRIYSINIDFRLSEVTEVICVSNSLFSFESAPFSYVDLKNYTAVNGICVQSIGDGTSTVQPTIQSEINFDNCYIYGKLCAGNVISSVFSGRWVGCGYDGVQQVLITGSACYIAGLVINGGYVFGLNYASQSSPVIGALFQLSSNYTLDIDVTDLRVNFSNGPLIDVEVTGGGYARFNLVCPAANHADTTSPEYVAIKVNSPACVVDVDCLIQNSYSSTAAVGIDIVAATLVRLKGSISSFHTPVSVTATSGIVHLTGLSVLDTGATYSVTATSYSVIYAGATAATSTAHAVGGNYFDKPNPSVVQ